MTKCKFSDVVQTISSREIGNLADAKALGYVFPDARRKPFSIYTIKNLSSFINDPLKAVIKNICNANAAVAWANYDMDEKERIVTRLKYIKDKYPDLLESISLLKSNSRIAHVVTSYNETITHYQNVRNETMLKATKACVGFLNLIIEEYFK